MFPKKNTINSITIIIFISNLFWQCPMKTCLHLKFVIFMMLLQSPHHFRGAAIDKNGQVFQYYVYIDCVRARHYLMCLPSQNHFPAHLCEMMNEFVDSVEVEAQRFQRFWRETYIRLIDCCSSVETLLSLPHFPRYLIAFFL